MSEGARPQVAVVDYGLGNLFSVKHACEHAGMETVITSDGEQLLRADAVLLPGVGAFGDAMSALERLELISVLKDLVASGKPLVGICLGMQLLMSESVEFGRHRGLGFIEGDVVRLEESRMTSRPVKVPEVGWNRLRMPRPRHWEGSLLDGLEDGEFMYFVHSFYVRPADPSVMLSTTRYGSMDYCSSFQRRNLFACQFHPERSGPSGLRVYRNLARQIRRAWREREVAHV